MQSLGIGQRSMRELLTVQDGGGGEKISAEGGNTAAEKEGGGGGQDSPLTEEEVEGIRQRTAAFLLGEER